MENILKERMIYEPPRFMTCGLAANQLLRMINSWPIGNGPRLTENCLAIGMARIGCPDQSIVVATLREFSRDYEESNGKSSNTISAAIGGPLHSLVIPGDLHEMEEEFLVARYKWTPCCSRYLPRFFVTSNQEASPSSYDIIKDCFLLHKNLVRSLSPLKK